MGVAANSRKVSILAQQPVTRRWRRKPVSCGDSQETCMPPTSVPARRRHWLWPPMLLLALVTATLAWLFVALLSGRQAGWMAVLAALEIAFMLRLGGFPAGPARVAVTVLGTALVALAANWGIASAYLGGSMGLNPWDSSLRMGPFMAWTLIQLANGATEVLWLAVALVIGWWTAR